MNTEKHTVTLPIEDYNALIANQKDSNGADEYQLLAPDSELARLFLEAHSYFLRNNNIQFEGRLFDKIELYLKNK